MKKGDAGPHLENFLNYSASESCIVSENCTTHCEVSREESEFANTLGS